MLFALCSHTSPWATSAQLTGAECQEWQSLAANSHRMH